MSTRPRRAALSSLTLRMMLGLVFFAVPTWGYAWMGREPVDLATVWPLACFSALQ